MATADTASLGESVMANLAAGTYYLSVMSVGNYGDVGQYTVGAYVPEPAMMSLMLIALVALRRRASTSL